MYRFAFWKVMEAYNAARSLMGQAGAMDFTKITGGKGAQYNPSAGQDNFRMIDFTVYVLQVVKELLDTQEMQFFEEKLQDSDLDIPVQSEEFLRMQERLGRAFMGRGLYPVRRYFAVVKK
jgi:hypothetical protein